MPQDAKPLSTGNKAQDSRLRVGPPNGGASHVPFSVESPLLCPPGDVPAYFPQGPSLHYVSETQRTASKHPQNRIYDGLAGILHPGWVGKPPITSRSRHRFLLTALHPPQRESRLWPILNGDAYFQDACIRFRHNGRTRSKACIGISDFIWVLHDA